MALVRFKSSTLVEVLVAASILSLVSGMAIMVFLAMSSPRANGQRLHQAQQVSYTMLPQNPILYEKPLDRNLERQGMRYMVNWKEEGRHLYSATVSVYQEGDVPIYQRMRLYYVEE